MSLDDKIKSLKTEAKDEIEALIDEERMLTENDDSNVYRGRGE